MWGAFIRIRRFRSRPVSITDQRGGEFNPPATPAQGHFTLWRKVQDENPTVENRGFPLRVRVDGAPTAVAFRSDFLRRTAPIVVRTRHGYLSPSPASTAAYPSRKVG